MADTPTPRSYPQTLGDMFDAFLSKQGIRSLRVGGPIVSLLEAAAQSDMRNSQDIFNLLTSADLDNATGLALARKGRDEKVPKIEIAPSTGIVTVTDSTFTQTSSKLFQGAPAPIVGSVALEIVDAISFPSTGQVYIGRGTNNYEGPLSYTSKTNLGTHWELGLSSGTTKFHNTSETVILAQGGNRVIGAGTIVRTPQANVANAIEFRTLFDVTLPDGETVVTGIDVVAQQPGQIGNVIATAIKEFSNAPFTGAVVTNPSPFVNGHETESDDDYRERIRAVRASRQLGTTLAIETAVTGITAPDENKRVSSASLVKRFGFASTLYIDDGTGYEAKTAAVALESLTDNAVGGETHFETTQRPIARAFAITKNDAPFTLRSTDQLSVKVGGVLYTHAFNDADFHSISSASAFEVVASINSNPDIKFVARTAESGTKVVIFANADTNEDIEVVTAVSGTDANDGLGLPAGVNYTMRLYKNDRLLVKDGVIASVNGQSFAQWDAVAGAQSLSISVDGTPTLTFTFVDQDFIDANTGYATVGRNSLAAWAAVINAKVPGITATVNSGRLVLTSNAGPVAKAAVAVVGGSLVTAHFFGLVSAQGAPQDYTLDRNEAQISLTQILEPGDRLTAGSLATRAFLESDVIGVVTIASDAKLWFVVDGDAKIIQHGVTPSTPVTISVESSHDWGNDLRISTSPTNAFENVQAQDWVVLWDPALPASLRGVFRVNEGRFANIIVERHTASALRSGHRTVTLDPGVGVPAAKIVTIGGGIRPRGTINWAATILGALSTVEIYDPNTKTTIPAAPMNVARVFHTATLLPSGKILVTGGMNDTGHLKSIETYDPVADTWTTSGVQLGTAVKGHTATLLTDGRVLIAGGDNNNAVGIDAYQIYSPGGDTITAVAHMQHPRSRHCAVKLTNNNVLIAGGFDNTNTDQATAELFTPGIDTTAATASMTRARSGFGMSLVGAAPTKVIAIGNHFGVTGKASYEEFSIAGSTWGAETTIPHNVVYEDKDVLRVTNGNVVGLHGWDSTSQPSQAGFVYDGTTFTATTSNTLISDGSARWHSTLAEIKNGTGTIKNSVVCVDGNWQHSTAWNFQSTAILEQYDTVGDAWTMPDPAVGGPFNLTQTGIAFVRSDGFVQQITVPAGANYTANSLVTVLDGLLKGATAVPYKTTRLRVNTNTFAASGDIALVTENQSASALQLLTTDAVQNLVPHVGSVQSGSSELGTPSFEDVRSSGLSKGAPLSQVVVTSGLVSPDYSLVGLRNWWRGINTPTVPPFTFSQYLYNRANSNFQFRTRMANQTPSTFTSFIEPRLASPEPWGPLDRAYLAAPYAMSPNGTLSVQLDNDFSKQFNINMWRLLKSVGNTYSSTNTFKDGDAGNVSLATTFGLGYDFNDFAVYMASRAAAFIGDASRNMLFRYFRLGPDGDGVRVRFGNPDAPNSQLLVQTVLNSAGTTDVTARIASGAPRTVTVHNSTRFGRASTNLSGGNIATLVEVLNLLISSATRAGNVTTLTLTLPAGVTDHGLNNGNSVWVKSTDVNFSSGLKTITARAPTTISYVETAANAGPDANPGTVSFDSQGEATYNGSGTVALDFFRHVDPTHLVSMGNATLQIQSVTDQYATVKTGDELDGSLFPVTTTLVWVPILLAANLQVFANAPQTATAVSTAINALRAIPSSTCPIGTTILGNGAGLISQNTADFLDNTNAWYVLSDGVNWVQTTTSPGSIAGDYQLAFKNPINGTLSVGADWTNEVIKIVPITTPNVVGWLNTPTITGLFTDTEIVASDDGTRVQLSTLTPGSAGGVQVQGGLANFVTAPVVGTPISIGLNHSGSTIAILDGEAMSKGMWARIQNQDPLPKLDVMPAGTQLTSWGTDGLLQFAGNVVDVIVPPTDSKILVEKQGAFIAVSDMGTTGFFSFGTVTPGMWLRVTPATSPIDPPQVSAANQGIFRILRVAQTVGGNAGTIFIENGIAIEEFSECKIAIYGQDSVIPGDQLIVLSDVWGATNLGTWTVQDVGTTTATSGDSFANSTSFVVDVSARTPAPQSGVPALTSTTATLNYIIEGQPGVAVMKVDGITLNQDDGDFLNIRWDRPVTGSAIAAASGSVITILDKLNFSTDFALGADGYRYDIGLLAEANRVVYGDSADTATYPGVAAADSHINIQGPLVKRIQVALSLRVKSGLNTQDIANRARSAVATVVNKTPIGGSISFSDIIDAVKPVVGVVSVTIVSPLYDVEHDQITVQPYEKPFVLDLTQDVQVSFVGV